jgi:hypothetical protein
LCPNLGYFAGSFVLGLRHSIEFLPDFVSVLQLSLKVGGYLCHLAPDVSEVGVLARCQVLRPLQRRAWLHRLQVLSREIVEAGHNNRILFSHYFLLLFLQETVQIGSFNLLPFVLQLVLRVVDCGEELAEFGGRRRILHNLVGKFRPLRFALQEGSFVVHRPEELFQNPHFFEVVCRNKKPSLDPVL